MVFKRRDRRGILQVAREAVWPRGGWGRAVSYVKHRMQRLPDDPYRIARGLVAGIWVSFTPFFGFHFVLAAAVAWLMRGNIVGALLATFVINPVTIPFVAATSVAFGNWLIGHDGALSAGEILQAFSKAGGEFWHNLSAFSAGEPTHWEQMAHFFDRIYYPYLLGGILPGLIAGLLFAALCLPFIKAYQAGRAKRMQMLKAQRRAEMGHDQDAD